MSKYDFKTIIEGMGHSQFGKQVLATQIRFATLEALFEVDEEVQRKLDPGRRAEIRQFILESLKDNDFYFSPFIFSARGAVKETADHGWALEPGSKLFILDGQHRSAAMASALSSLKSQKEAAEETGNDKEAQELQGYIEKLRDYPVAMQVYLNLSTQEEKQLFTDINTERKEAHTGIIMQYDHRDAYTELTRNVAKKLLHKFEIEQQLSRLTNQNTAMTSLTTMRKCLLALFEGNLSVKKGNANFGRYSEEEVMTIAHTFFESWMQVFPKQMANRKKFVTGLTGIQVALALTVYNLTKNQSISHLEAIAQLKLLNKLCTWKHDDSLFSHLYDSAARKITHHSSSTAIQRTTVKFLAILNKKGKGNFDCK